MISCRPVHYPMRFSLLQLADCTSQDVVTPNRGATKRGSPRSETPKSGAPKSRGLQPARSFDRWEMSTPIRIAARSFDRREMSTPVRIAARSFDRWEMSTPIRIAARSFDRWELSTPVRIAARSFDRWELSTPVRIAARSFDRWEMSTPVRIAARAEARGSLALRRSVKSDRSVGVTALRARGPSPPNRTNPTTRTGANRSATSRSTPDGPAETTSTRAEAQSAAS